MGSGASDAVSLALAFHRAPARFPDLLHGRGPLPGALGVLLRLAGGATLDDEDIQLGGFVPAEEVQKAALFFIEQALLAHEGDHYRTLGLAPGAAIEEIKEHHRLLMRLFHPDRKSVSEEWRGTYATRINLAYNALRHTESRAAYDASRARLRSQPAAQPWRPPVPRRRPPLRRGLWARMPSAVTRYFPQLVLGALALIASLSVAMVYYSRPPAGAIGAGPEQAPRFLPRVEADKLFQHVTPAPVAEAYSVAPSPEDKPAAAAAVPVEEVVAEAGAAPSLQGPAPAAAPKSRRLPPSASTAAVSTEAAAGTEAAAPRLLTAAVAMPSAATVHAERELPAEPAPLAQGLDAEQLAALVLRFAGAYERGDLEGFMALFDESARAEQGGKAYIRSDYEGLFRNSGAREIYIFDIAWVREGEIARGEGSYQAKVMRRGESVPRIYAGTIRLEVIKRGEGGVISRIHHTSATPKAL